MTPTTKDIQSTISLWRAEYSESYAKNEMFSILIYNAYQVQTPRFVNNNAKQMLHDHKEREYI